MKRLTALFALLAATFVLASVPLAGSPAAFSVGAGPRTGAPSQDDPIRKFREEFDQALKLNNNSAMDALIGKYEEAAINSILITAEGIAGAPNEVLLTRFEGYRAAWKRKKGSKFPDKVERMFANMPSATKRQRITLKGKYDACARKLLQLQADKNKDGLKLAADEMMAYGEGFKEVGDHWYESQAFFRAGIAISETYLGKKDVDLNKVADAYERCINARDAVDIKDKYYKQVLPAMKTLHGKGYGASGKGAETVPGGPKAKPTGPAANGAAVTAKMSFELLPANKDSMRPSYYLDWHLQIWPAVFLAKVGSTAKILRLKDGPTVIRESASKIMLDMDADGKGDFEWPTRGKFETFQMKLGSGASERPWALLTEVGREQDFYQGQPMNLLATDDGYQVYYTAGGAMVGDISGVQIQIVDDNLDGVYGSPPLSWGHQGIVPKNFQLEFDSIRIGKDKKARPFSRLVDLGGSVGWHELTVKDGGNTIEAQPMTVKTGSVRLKVKGLKPDFFVLKGLDDELTNTFIDIAGGKKVELPVGNYELGFGLVRKGSKLQLMKAVIMAGPDSPRYQVKAGETLEIVAGAPYSFDFAYEVGESEVTVVGESIRILGAGGEAYDRFYGCVPYVDAEIRRKGAKRGQDNVRLKPVVDNLGLEKHGWKGMWKPISAKLVKKDGEVEVQITEKKNKLFGKLASGWK